MKSGGLVLVLIGVRLVAQAPVNSRGASQIGKASIEGTVIDSITREPVRKASVGLSGGANLAAVTDAAGHFAFRLLPAGKYTIQAQGEKYPRTLPGVEDGHQLSITVATEEQKRDVTLTLTPGAVIRGRVTDEEGSPMHGCTVTAMQFRDTEVGRTLQGFGWAQSDAIGEYRVSRILPGKYYLMAQCYGTIQLPHAFIRRDSPLDVPVLTYSPQFYPGATDPAGATRVEAQASANIEGIHFRMMPAAGITVRGHAGPLPSDRNLQIALEPKDRTRREWQTLDARVNGPTGEFRFPNVAPGSYELIAIGSGDGHSYFAKVPVEIGAVPLEPIEVALTPAPSLSGTISIEGDVKVPMTNLQVRMDPLDGLQIQGDPRAEVQKDGTFTFNSVVPGRWRLFVEGSQGYMKSVTRGDQEFSPEDIEIGPAASLLKIVIGTKVGELNVSPPQSSESGQYSALVWREHSYRDIRGIGPQGPTRISVPPGKYHVCAVANGQPWILMQNHALLKALESVCEGVEVSEGGSASVQMRVVTAQELRRLMEKLEE